MDTLPGCEFLTQPHKEFLNKLRRSGVTNMYGAGPFIMDEFNVDRATSHKILGEWMKTFTREDE